MNLTDEQWQLVRPFLPDPPPHPRGGHPWKENRAVLDGILWVMRTGSPWSHLPPEHPSRKVCRRAYLEWKQSGALQEVLIGLAEDLRYRGHADVGDAFELPPLPQRGTWWWQTYLLLRSPLATALLREDHKVAPSKITPLAHLK